MVENICGAALLAHFLAITDYLFWDNYREECMPMTGLNVLQKRF
jgi:hypothetical protein